MRLWHQDLIHYLPSKQLLGQHRECCALRGKGWGKKHSVVNYVFMHPYSWLFYYHRLVMIEMTKRGYQVKLDWTFENYRGSKIGYQDKDDPFVRTDFEDHSEVAEQFFLKDAFDFHIYEEHDDKYLLECIENLEGKRAKLVNWKTLSDLKLKLAIRGN